MTLHDGLTSVAALMCIVVLILCARPILRLIGQRRLGSRSGRSELMLVEQIVLDRTRRLSVVRHGAREILLLTGGTQDIMMDWTSREGFDAAILEAAEGEAG